MGNNDLNDNSLTSYRQAWVFPWAVDELLTGAKEKRTYHESRKTWWSNKKEETIKSIKTDGIVIDESIVDALMKGGYSSNAINGRHVNVSIDQSLQQDLSECVTKIKEHEKKIKEYDTWVQILEAEDKINIPNNTLPITQEDFVFFFGK